MGFARDMHHHRLDLDFESQWQPRYARPTITMKEAIRELYARAEAAERRAAEAMADYDEDDEPDDDDAAVAAAHQGIARAIYRAIELLLTVEGVRRG